MSLTPISKQSKMQASATTLPAHPRAGLPRRPARDNWRTPSFGSGAPVCSVNGMTAVQRDTRVQLPNGTWTTVKVGGFRCSRSCGNGPTRA